MQRLVAASVVFFAVVAGSPPVAALTPGPEVSRYRHQSWTTRDGLPSDVVRAVVQARDRYVWVGTQEGLARFDGARFTAPAGEASRRVAACGVTSLRQDDAAVIWAGTNGAGVARVTDGGVALLDRAAGVPHGYVRDTAPIPGGPVWIGTAHGLASVSDGVLRALSGAHPLAHANVRALAVARGDVWVGTRNGLWRLDATGAATRAADGTPASRTMVRALHVDRDGTVWAGTDEGLVRVGADGGGRVFGAADGLPHPIVTAVLRDRDGHLWVATKGGVVWLDGERLRPAGLGSVCDGAVVAMAEDDEGGLWAGTDGCGLHRFADASTALLGTDQGLPEARLGALAAAADGTVWLASRDGALYRWRPPGRAEPVAFQRPGGGGLIAQLHVPPSGALYVVLVDGRVFRGDDRGFVPYVAGGAAAVSYVLEDHAGDVWLATDVPGRFLRVHGGAPAAVDVPVGAPRLVYESPRGTLWLGGAGGVARREGDRFTTFPLAAEAFMMVEDARGSLWIATLFSGLRRLRDGVIASIGDAEGLPAQRLFGVWEDGAGSLWFSASKGIFRVAMAELDDLAEGRRADVAATLHGRGERILLGPEPYGRPMGIVRPDGALWFATKYGIATIPPPRAAHAGARPLEARFEQVRLDGRDVATTGVVARPVGHGDLEVRYTALAFDAPDQVRFRYRLAGFDAAWIDADGGRTVRYPGLQPGRFRFELQARGGDGRWGPPRVLTLALAPPFQRTPLFYALVGAVCALAAIAWHRVRLAQASARHRAVLAERERIARDIHDTLGQTFAAISLQTECIDRALRDQPARAGEYIQEVRGLVASGIAEARRSVQSLRPRALLDGTLADAIREAARAFATGVPIDVAVEGTPRPLDPDLEDALYRIAQEAMTNAVRHARATRIGVQLRFADDGVGVSVRDDGGGLRAPSSASAGGRGLEGMRQRAAAVDGRLTVTSNDRGTEIIVEVNT